MDIYKTIALTYFDLMYKHKNESTIIKLLQQKCQRPIIMHVANNNRFSYPASFKVSEVELGKVSNTIIVNVSANHNVVAIIDTVQFDLNTPHENNDYYLSKEYINAPGVYIFNDK